MKKYNLDDRLIEFTVKIIELADNLPKTNAGIYYSNQLIRSASSGSLNYAEAQSGESRKDFVHKLMISLKELRETFTGLKVLTKLKMMGDKPAQKLLMKENNELISILMKSVMTARENMNNS